MSGLFALPIILLSSNLDTSFKLKSSAIMAMVYQNRMMSSTSASALLYAATVSMPSISTARPDDSITKTEAWHIKSGDVIVVVV